MPVNITTLNNGLRVASSRMAEVDTVSISIWTGVGTRYENPAEGGISHLLEHMLFKGTKRRTALQIAKEFDAVGGYLNAYTSREQTVYYAKILKEDLALAIDVLSDMLQHSVMDKEELAREHNVVVQEISQTLDTPDDIIFDYHQEAVFKDQNLGRPVLGTEKTVTSITSEILHCFVDDFYTPHNMVVAAAGNLDHEIFAKLVEASFTKKAQRKECTDSKPMFHGSDTRIARELEQLHFMMGFEGLSYHHKNFPALQLLCMILSGGMSSRLFQEIREKRGLAYTIQAYNSSYKDTGLISIYAGTSPDKAKELTHVLCQELQKIMQSVTGEELTHAKTQAKASVLMDKESTGARAEELGRHLTCFGRHIPSQEYLDRVMAVTKDDITRVAQGIFGSKPAITALGQITQVPEYTKIVSQLS